MSLSDSESDSFNIDTKSYGTDFSSTASEDDSEAEQTTATGNLNGLSKNEIDGKDKNNGSQLFVKKPPIVPRRLSITSIKSEQQMPTKALDHDHDHDLLANQADTNRMHTPKDSFRSCIQQVKIAPMQKIENSEVLIRKMLHEYEQSIRTQNDQKQTANQEALKEHLLSEYITLTTLNLIGYGENSLQHAKACLRLAEFYLEYRQYAKQAEQHSRLAESILFKIDYDKHMKNEDYCCTWMHLYTVMSQAYSMLKK
jgi:hypothetical protein